MSTRLNPYLQFDGTAREAMTFYHSVFGGVLELSTFTELGMPVPQGDEHRIMHGQLIASDSVVLMGSDLPSSMTFVAAAGLPICLNGTDTELLRGWWEGLLEGGTASMPLAAAPWGDLYGQLTDRFGIEWMFNVAAPTSED